MSRGGSSEALRDYRASQRPPPAYAPPRPSSPPVATNRGWEPGGGWGATMPRRVPSWGGGWDTVSPRRSFGTGVVTGVALWAALNALTSSPSQAEYFYAHRNDPAYREWRQEAERAAARDPEVAAKLSELDRRMAQLEAQPGSTGGGPTVGREPARDPEGGFSLWGIILVIGGVVVLFWLWRRRAGHPRGGTPAGTQPGLAGSAESRFRVGMVLPVDPAPFLLAAGLTKIQPPDESGMISIEAVGLLRYGRRAAASSLPAWRAGILSASSRNRRPPRRVPLFLVSRRGRARRSAGMGFLARPARRHDRLADVPDQGWQALRAGLGSRPDPYRAATDRGDPAISGPRGAPQICRRCCTERRPAARRRRHRPNTFWSARSRLRARPGSKSTPASISIRRRCSCRAYL